MPIFILTTLARFGVPQAVRKLTAWLILALVAALLIWGFKAWLSSERKQAIELDRADITQEVTNRVIAADREANANATVADAIAQDNEKELDREVSKSDGNRVDAVLQRMREQQAAGRR